MKKIFQLVVTLILLNFNLNVQAQKSNESLLIIKNKLLKEVKILQDSIKKIDLLIVKNDNEKILKEGTDSFLVSKCKKEAKLKENPEGLSKVIAILPEGSLIRILDYNKGYYGVCHDTICGYMNEIWIEKNDKILKFAALKDKQRLELEELARQGRIFASETERQEQKKKDIKKYGLAVYTKLEKGEIWIGMNEEMAILSRGLPEKRNSTVGKWGWHEQWVYENNLYLYFENGILTSYQF